jgi:hypothetical protein
MLPIAISSMQQVLGRGSDPLSDMVTGDRLTTGAAVAAEAEATYFNLGVIDLDVGTGLATVAVSGNRICPSACPALALTFVSLDDDADQRRGLPPSASLTLAPDVRVFSQSVQLPVRGQPSLYPFDTYQLWLGVVGVATLPEGTTVELHPDNLAGRVLTVQNREGTFIMRPPVPIDPSKFGPRPTPSPSWRYRT